MKKKAKRRRPVAHEHPQTHTHFVTYQNAKRLSCILFARPAIYHTSDNEMSIQRQPVWLLCSGTQSYAPNVTRSGLNCTLVQPQCFRKSSQRVKKSSLRGGRKCLERCSRRVSENHTRRAVGEFEDVMRGRLVLRQLKEVVWGLGR